ncbi:unnamed protein product, partial [Discosporangium mesarthrocarpum]
MSEDLEARVAALEGALNVFPATYADAADVDVAWVLLSAILVFFMQVGFAMLEVGSVSPKNTKAVLIKNIGDASMGALTWWLLGYGLAYGTDSGGFIGSDNFALRGKIFQPPGHDSYFAGMKYGEWVFNWAFAATSVTIVSGAIAERVKIVGYVIYAIVLTSFIYPVVVHWTWHEDGWASPYRSGGEEGQLPLFSGCGAADFAGSGVVHMVGGAAALVATIVTKARMNRFRPDGTVNRLPQQSPALQTLGTLILW